MTAVEQLLDLQTAPDRYDIAPADVRQLQIDAVNERFAAHVEQIPLLRNRSQSAEVSKVVEGQDLVPLLFAHGAYKSYAQNWLTDGRWDRMAKWVGTVSTCDSAGVDVAGVSGLDGFVARMESAGCYLTCSSGTTGKPAMIACSESDLDVASRANVTGLTWATGIPADGSRKLFGLGPRTNVERNERTRIALVEAFSTEADTYQLPVDPISVGSIMGMIDLRRRIADGTAGPSEIAAFETTSAARQSAMDTATAEAVDELIASRERQLLLTGMFASLYQVALGVRAKGLSGSDFRDDTALLVAGGLKGAALPPDYREFIFGTFNIADERVYHFYTMQELNTPFPKCRAGRYHVPPWVLLLPLDEPGENLVDTSVGPVQARGAFFDLSLDGRWGGVISGDRIDVDFGACECGHQGPTIGPDITRYADLGGDKITCSGTIDAYVRGEA
ncbi:hypothetical protein A5731_12225 [Mycolicibacterium conceptionense]|uniref:Acyl-protein synthetase, LuxE n=1 Tax=Mycolicibacterium conceptionense TaxID=451644 RepID=A0A1A1WC95_9MYCO|nr:MULTISPECIES: hypothetical protein [Mycolicibacterium]MCW1820509.1 hypothetical protein [Mycolicibacterium senegalense]OBB12078.1 hypothetical protein A5718_05720 [Mycolicibacterium conceptionense]OBF04463.1 hypothetical protein A5731_12225 [Mycolicibacterium conceptionense]OBF13325.1 hypothetical protein A5726_27385 [Mycolicibacterium conceptionense]OBF44672.1 hypothetical protein A5720_11100 [Mycolicibacterium conceptionense]